MSSIPCQAKIKWITFENAKDSSHSMGEDQRNQTDGCEEHGAKREDQNNPGTIRNQTSHDKRDGKTPSQTVGGLRITEGYARLEEQSLPELGRRQPGTSQLYHEAWCDQTQT